jgi:hypothetical protein
MLFTTHKNDSNYQDLLKTLAIIAVVIDHIGLYLYPDIAAMRAIGRIAMPLFCFFAGYNFNHRPKHKIIVWGVLFQIYTIILFKKFMVANILIPIYLGQWYIYFVRNDLNTFFYGGYLHVVGMGLLWCVTWVFVDYGTIVIAIMILGYIARHDALNLKLCSFIAIIISILHTITAFALYFSDSNIMLVIILSALTYTLMVARSFNQKIFINLQWISRNTLYIYSISTAILQYMCIHKNW